MALCPKIFLVVCPNCVPNVMLLSSKPQSFHIILSAALRCYGLNMRQTVCHFLQCNMSKRGDHGTDKHVCVRQMGGGGAVALWKSFF